MIKYLPQESTSTCGKCKILVLSSDLGTFHMILQYSQNYLYWRLSMKNVEIILDAIFTFSLKRFKRERNNLRNNIKWDDAINFSFREDSL